MGDRDDGSSSAPGGSCVAALAGAALALVGCGRGVTSTPAPPPPVLTGVVAHRGASFAAPENTLVAFDRGWALGAESCELDVRLTADGEVVVIHDETTARTGGVDRPVAAQTLAELRALDVGAWKSPRQAGERIPTLAETLARVPRGRVLFVEVKSGLDTVPAIAAAIVVADPASRGASIALQAYDADVLAAMAARLPAAPAYWTVDAPPDGQGGVRPYGDDVIAAATARGFAGLAVDVRGADDRFVAAVAAAGLSLDVWTIDDAAGLAAWRGRARWVETNRPELAR